MRPSARRLGAKRALPSVPAPPAIVRPLARPLPSKLSPRSPHLATHLATLPDVRTVPSTPVGDEEERGITVREDDDEDSNARGLTRWEKVERAVGWKRAQVLPHIPHPDREVNGPIPLWVLAATPITVALVAVFGFKAFDRAIESSPSQYLTGRTRDRSTRRAPRPDLVEERQGLVL